MGNKDALLAGAKRCLAEKGYAASTVRDIAGAAGVSMAAIGYHFGTREALLNLALFDLLDEWGRTLAEALAADGDSAGSVEPERRYTSMWSRAIESFTANEALFAASVEAALLSRRSPELRAQLSAGLSAGRAGMAATLLGVAEESVTEGTVRTLGSVQLALISGILLQCLTDGAHAPSAEQIVTGLRGLADVLEGRAEQE